MISSEIIAIVLIVLGVLLVVDLIGLMVIDDVADYMIKRTLRRRKR